MRRTKQRPTEQPGWNDHIIREHPAFGCVVVTRPSGSRRTAELFGSRVPVNSYISITLHEAREDRGLQYSRHSAGRTVGEFHMTEAQFASLFGAIGMGSGVPCTFVYRQTGPMEEVPEIEDFSLADDRGRHIREMTEKKMAALKEAVDKLDVILKTPGSVKRSDLQEVRRALTVGVDNAGSDFQFAADMLNEHLADTMAELQQELHAYSATMSNRIERSPPTEEIAEITTSNP